MLSGALSWRVRRAAAGCGAGRRMVEAPRSRERSFCCGAGGGLAFLGEETGERVSHVRAAELVATGAGVVAAACPFCNTMLRDALAARGEGAPELMDIAQLVARGLPKEDVIQERERSKMKIVVAIKQVPDRDAPVRIAANAKWIEERELQWAMNEPDAYALEEALQLKEKHGGEVIVLSAGPERVGIDDSRGAGQGRGPGDPHRLRRPGRARRVGRGAAARRGHQAGESRPGADRIAVRRSGTGPDRRDSRRVARPAPRHADPARGEDRCRPQGEARARRGVVSDRSRCRCPRC